MSSDTEAPLSHADFLPYRGEEMRVEGWPHALRLADVRTERPPGWPDTLRAPFALRFDAPSVAVLPEGLHVITAGDGRRFTLHIMPVHTPHAAGAPARQAYQAVFN